MKLSELEIGVCARVEAVGAGDPVLEAKLREVGFAEEDEVELVQRGPLMGRPLCFRLNSTLIALRPEEASVIKVTPLK